MSINKRFILVAALLVALGGAAVLLLHWYAHSGDGAVLTQQEILEASRKLQAMVPTAQAAPVPLAASRSIRLAVGSLGLADDNQNRQLGDLVTAELSGAPGLELVERQSLDKVLAELQLSLSGLVRAKDAIAVGKLLRADWFLLGTGTMVAGMNAIVVRVVDARTGILRDAGAFISGQGPAGLTSDLATFVRQCRKNASSGKQPVYLAIGTFQDLGIYVYGIAVQADGKIVVGGAFTTLSPNGGAAVTRNRIARLDPVTGAPDSFDPNANATVTAIAVQADGRILAGGGFSGANSIGGQPRNRMARLDGATGLADSFNPNPNIDVDAIAVQADGKILASGGFTTIGGATRHYIGRLDATTGAADSFNPSASDPVVSMVLQADGKILAGGLFNEANSIGGTNRNYIARLDPTTGLADSFDTTNANNQVQSIAVQADGKILAGGNFTTIGGQTRNYFARLSNDTAALQNLIGTQSTVTWTRGGSSVRSTRVTFESSTDNVAYTPLGNGTAAGSNWTLTGLNLPTGQNLYIRARGYYSSGFYNGSESVTESVRNVFLTPLVATPPLLNIQLSVNTNVVLSWAASFAGFTLEANTNLTTNAWSVVSPAPTVSGTNNVMTNTVSGSTRFYRLRK